MKAKVIKGTIKMTPLADNWITITWGVDFTLDNNELKSPLRGFMTTSFPELTSANLFKALLEKEEASK